MASLFRLFYVIIIKYMNCVGGNGVIYSIQIQHSTKSQKFGVNIYRLTFRTNFSLIFFLTPNSFPPWGKEVEGTKFIVE